MRRRSLASCVVLGLAVCACQASLDLGGYSFGAGASAGRGGAAGDGGSGLGGMPGVGGGAGYAGAGGSSGGDGYGGVSGAGGASGDAGQGGVGPDPVLVAAFDHYSFPRASVPYVFGADRSVLLNDSAGLQVSPATITTERLGTVDINADGTFTYGPANAAFWGDDHFQYVAGNTQANVRLSVQPGVVLLGDLEQGAASGFALNGANVADLAGAAVSNAGDVNGDGLDDLIVGAASADPAAVEDSGAAYVVFGKRDTAAVTLPVAGAVAPLGFNISGAGVSDFTGRSVSSAGDVNGDGLGDLLVGTAAGDPAGLVDAGSAYVVFGKTDGATVLLAALQPGAMPGGFVINGVRAGDSAGRVVSGVGDVNGDGLDDIVVGAPFADSNALTATGAAYVVFGKTSLTPVSLSAIEADDLSQGFAILGADEQNHAGLSVSDGGDINGDGLGDLLVSAPDANGTGAVYVVFGQRVPEPVSLVTLETAGGGGFVIEGAAGDDQAGLNVSGAGDVNGDGLDDVVVGTLPTDRAVATAYVVLGKQATDPVDLAAFAPGAGAAGFPILGLDLSVGGDQDLNFFVGGPVSRAGDVNGDGLDDVIVGSYGADRGGISGAGAAFLIFGTRAPAAVSLSTLGAAGFEVRGVRADDAAGVAVSGGADINGDGLSDLLVGAHGTDGLSTPRPAAYAIFGWDATDALGVRELALVGSSGDDTLNFTGVSLVSARGGSGTDTLRFVGQNLALDLRSRTPRLDGIERIDLTGTGNNQLSLDDAAIRRTARNRTAVPAGLERTLVVVGDAGDAVVLDTLGYTKQPPAVDGVDVWVRNGGIYGLEISSAISLTPP